MPSRIVRCCGPCGEILYGLGEGDLLVSPCWRLIFGR